MVPGWFFMVFLQMYLPQLYSGPTIQSRSAARRAAQDLVMIMGLMIMMVMVLMVVEMLRANITPGQL